MPKALLLENLHPHARTILEAAGYDVTTRTGALDESELIDRAETLLRTGHAKGALEATRLHAACDETILDQERERIAIEALVVLGQDQEATARARAFEARYPSSPHLRRIRQLVGLGAE